MNASSPFDCPICFERYDEGEHNPKILLCGHSCCLDCLRGLITGPESNSRDFLDMKPSRKETHMLSSSSSGKTSAFTCPICRKTTYSDLTALTTNYAILNTSSSSTAAQSQISGSVHDCCQCKKIKRPVVSHCVTCNQYLCQGHSDNHQDDFEDHSLTPMSNGSRVTWCSIHKKKELELYCKHCKICVCSLCYPLNHQTHPCISLEDALAEMKGSIGSRVSPLDVACADMSMCVCRLDELVNDLAKKEMDMAQQIHDSFQTIQLALDNRRNELISSLPSKRLLVEAHKHSIQSLLTRVTDKTQSCKQQLLSNDIVQVLLSKESISNLLSTADDEMRTIDWREEKYDRHMEFNDDKGKIIPSIRQLSRINQESAKIRPLAVAVASDSKTAAAAKSVPAFKTLIDPFSVTHPVPPPPSRRAKQPEPSKDDPFLFLAKQVGLLASDLTSQSSITRPCRNELECRRTIVAILKQTRGETTWNGPDDKGNEFNWSESRNLNGWNGLSPNNTSSPCRIQVDAEGMIKELFLNRLGMRGELPDIIGNLTSLNVVDFGGNQLSGIPSSIGNLSSLTRLDVNDNRLTALPDTISRLALLTTLRINSNRFNATYENEFKRRISRPGLGINV